MKLHSSNKRNDERFEILNGPTYSRHELPPSWQNETTLLTVSATTRESELEHAPLADFPLIRDFEVLLERYVRLQKAPLGYHVNFFSKTLGYLADFPWWDHAEEDLRRDDFRIPLGDFLHPFNDVEQSWEIVIGEKDGLVYILEGAFSKPHEGYPIWFKVYKDMYLGAWQRAIALCKGKSTQSQIFLLGSGDSS